MECIIKGGYMSIWDNKDIKDIIEICEKYNFEELDLCTHSLKIEFVGDFECVNFEDFETKYDYYRASDKITKRSIEPYFLKLWEELKKVSFIEKYEWDYDDYPCYYIYFTEDFIEAELTNEIDNEIQEFFNKLEKKYNIHINYNGFNWDFNK